MTDGLAMLQRQLEELDGLAKRTLQDLNTVAGTEQIARWKARTAVLLTESVSPEEGRKFASLQPSPSFTNDMVEEFTDLVDCYRTPLMAIIKQLAHTPRPSTHI